MTTVVIMDHEKEAEDQKLAQDLRDVSDEIIRVDEYRRDLGARRRRIMWNMLALPKSLREVAKIAGMHRGAVHKDLSRHPIDTEEETK